MLQLLADAGGAETRQRIEAAGGTPWDLADRTDANFGRLRDNVRQLLAAARQVAASGKAGQVERAVAIVCDTPQQLYGLLAED
jgi:hypothetical protein